MKVIENIPLAVGSLCHKNRVVFLTLRWFRNEPLPLESSFPEPDIFCVFSDNLVHLLADI